MARAAVQLASNELHLSASAIVARPHRRPCKRGLLRIGVLSRSDSIIRAGGVAASLLVLGVVAVLVTLPAVLAGFAIGPWLSILVVVLVMPFALRWWHRRSAPA
jgi:hypothetical protein